MDDSPPRSRIRSILASYTIANQTPLALIIRIIRSLLLLLALANICALLAGLQIFRPFVNNPYYYSFQDTSHLALNTFLLMAVTYSFLGRAEWSPATRLTTGLVLVVWCVSLTGSQFKNIIVDDGGCAHGDPFNNTRNQGSSSAAAELELPIKARCEIQMAVGGMNITWAVLLVAELFLTHTYREQQMVKFWDRATEMGPVPRVVHVYQPDLSLNGDGAATNDAPTGAGAGANVATMEQETLPVYEPRSTGAPVHIIDMTRIGTVRGALDKNDKVAKFLNIPFGLVEERWRPAVKPKPWDGIRDATKLGPMPPQQTDNNPFLSMFLGVPDKYNFEEAMSERDCLNCNIFMPASAVVGSTEKLPVLVWVHGGGLRNGGNSIPLYDCSELVLASIELNKPMVVVAINYRLNYLGFISSKELILDAQEHAKIIPKEDRKWYDQSVGNWGLLDQILGLQWIQDHISAFSGNPKRVTVMGESAGASSISYLQLIPECRGLFFRSILQSGTATTLVTQYPEQEGQRIFDRLCRVFDVSQDLPALEKVARLRGVSAEAIADEVSRTTDVLFRPCLDSVLLKKDCRLVVGDTSIYDPALNWVLAGTCADEGTMVVEEEGATTVDQFEPFKRRLCDPADLNLFDQIYGVPQTDTEACSISSRVLNSGCFKFPTFQVSEAILAHPTCQLSRFHMDTVIQKVDNMIPNMGAHHGVDLPFTFGGNSTRELLSDEEKVMSRRVQAVWIEVATASSPEASSLPLVNCVLPPRTRSVKSRRAEEGPTEGTEETVEKENEEEGVVFSRDLTVRRGPVERMTLLEIEFWRRSNEYAAKQAAQGQAGEVGFSLTNGLTRT
ncbi:hypothetical protein BGX23_009490 [Mortierella sp. AD031]|nr:hypothetical protein BGX23_009490 [Mortierella sp. AD031]